MKSIEHTSNRRTAKTRIASAKMNPTKKVAKRSAKTDGKIATTKVKLRVNDPIKKEAERSAETGNEKVKSKATSSAKPSTKTATDAGNATATKPSTKRLASSGNETPMKKSPLTAAQVAFNTCKATTTKPSPPKRASSTGSKSATKKPTKAATKCAPNGSNAAATNRVAKIRETEVEKRAHARNASVPITPSSTTDRDANSTSLCDLKKWPESLRRAAASAFADGPSAASQAKHPENALHDEVRRCVESGEIEWVSDEASLRRGPLSGARATEMRGIPVMVDETRVRQSPTNNMHVASGRDTPVDSDDVFETIGRRRVPPKRGRGRGSLAWKHEIFALVIRTLRDAPQQDPRDMLVNFEHGLEELLYGELPDLSDLLGPFARLAREADVPQVLGVFDTAFDRGDPAVSLEGLVDDIRDIETHREEATLLLSKSIVMRSREYIRWTAKERMTWDRSFRSLPPNAKNETRVPCPCTACSDPENKDVRCPNGGPSLSAWERAAFEVACILLGKIHEPKTYASMYEESRSHM